MDAIRQAFADYFSHWSIDLPLEDPADRRSGEIRKAGWSIRYRFGEEEGAPCLDFYATHRMTNARLERIHADGSIEMLGAEQQMFAYDPDEPGDDERGRREMQKHNRAFREKLRELSLDRPPAES